MGFGVGETIIRRDVHRNGHIAAVETARVLRDDADGVLTWTGAGSQVMRRTTLDGAPVRKMTVAERDSVPTMLSPGVWTGTNVLMYTPTESAHSVWWFFDEAHTFLGWYVNLETPARRWAGGLDIQDQALDIRVSPDRAWSWKDEDEFAERTGHPDYWTATEAGAVRAEAGKVIAEVEAGVFPFDGALTRFRPEPTWEPTRLTPVWDLMP